MSKSLGGLGAAARRRGGHEEIRQYIMRESRDSHCLGGLTDEPRLPAEEKGGDGVKIYVRPLTPSILLLTGFSSPILANKGARMMRRRGAAARLPPQRKEGGAHLAPYSLSLSSLSPSRLNLWHYRLEACHSPSLFPRLHIKRDGDTDISSCALNPIFSTSIFVRGAIPAVFLKTVCMDGVHSNGVMVMGAAPPSRTLPI